MPIALNSVFTLLLILLAARIIKRHSRLLQRYFIPSSLVAGAIGLILGPQVIGVIPADITAVWSQLPKHLISVVFAGLFLGKHIPSAKRIWRAAGPMISFGMTLAWGQYVLGLLLAMFILTPFFGANPLVGALIEISFEGGHGTAGGLAPTFEQLGWPEGTDIALGIATVSIIVAITSGIFLINIHHRHRVRQAVDAQALERQQRSMIKSGYDLAGFFKTIEKHPEKLALHFALFALAIGLGWMFLRGLVMLEEAAFGGMTDMRFFAYVPLFPLAMIGGLCIQLIVNRLPKKKSIDRNVVHTFGAIALDFLIASAIATVSLNAISNNFAVFVILNIAGIAWILGCFIVLAPLMFKRHWFENGVTNMGQSMGMTATGLLLNKLVDPSDRTKARENFAYKQLVFEPFMGGGLVTAVSVVVIHQFGSVVALMISSAGLIFWLGLGLLLPRITK